MLISHLLVLALGLTILFLGSKVTCKLPLLGDIITSIGGLISAITIFSLCYKVL